VSFRRFFDAATVLSPAVRVALIRIDCHVLVLALLRRTRKHVGWNDEVGSNESTNAMMTKRKRIWELSVRTSEPIMKGFDLVR